MRYAVKRIDEIPGVPDPDPGDPDWKPLRHHFGLAIGGNRGQPYEISSWDAKWTSGLQQA